MAGDPKKTPPAQDEIEISLFGPGYGESVLIHSGGNLWFIIDSCLYSSTGQPASLLYLKSIGVDPSESVKQIIATHWHDDHIRGLGQIFRECQSAEFVCSEALKTKEFLTLVEAYSSRFMTLSGLTSGLREFREILYEMRDRGVGSPKFAVADRCIWRKQIDAIHGECTIHALSPSDSALLASKIQMSSLIPISKQTKKRAAALSPNRAAVALWISNSGLNILLGSDLEDEEGKAGLGWSAILASSGRPIGKASVFKVPHHGSITAHKEEIWKELLNDDPLAVLTPYKRGKTELPNQDDIKRLCSLSPQIFITARPSKGTQIPRDKAVERTIKETVGSIRTVLTKTGHFRVRIRPDSPWKIDLFDGALPLCEAQAN